jgi:hypothetical protein
MEQPKKDAMESATINGIGTSMRASEETTARLQPDGLPPDQSRMVGDHYEVKLDGEWVWVSNWTIINVVAPDGGAHVCAPVSNR